ncbi:hypothetical protein NDU88_004699 [Pleurodeles waltl]|uniref:Tyr recombinase domain-containing protein n=1 Tax=Pleurodeles waltl TaxID=8319 RepID=A0AAV7KZ50_PLEWA|nr:hypothetical protein NDU88_004699 [Pleurodeles waltl]
MFRADVGCRRFIGDLGGWSVKVRAPSEHRHEGRVRSGAVHPTSRERDGLDEAQPSTSQGAGAGCAYLDEELLDYEEELEVPDTAKKWVMVVAGEVPGVVQGGHVPAHRQEVSAGSLPRGEEGFVRSLLLHEGRDSFGDSTWAKVSKAMGGSRAIRNTVEASIQVSAVTEVEGKSEVSGGTGDGSLLKGESGEGGKKVDANTGGDEVDGSHLLASQFLAVLRMAVGRLGLEPSSYGTHSFRIGAATEARRQCKSDQSIKQLGKFALNRDGFSTYIKQALVPGKTPLCGEGFLA